MTVQQIVDYIQERINGAAYNEQLANEQWHQSKESDRRTAAYNLSQISTAQRLALQDVLNWIQAGTGMSSGETLVFDEMSVVIETRSSEEQRWTITSDVPFTLSSEGQKPATSEYGTEYKYYVNGFTVATGAKVSMIVQCEDGAMLTVEMCKAVQHG